MTERRCPICTARLRGTRTCRRCGADLAEVMRVSIAAWRLRREGWQQLVLGDVQAALRAALESSGLESSDSARRLAWLAQAIGTPPDAT